MCETMILCQILEKKLYLCKVFCSEFGISPLKNGNKPYLFDINLCNLQFLKYGEKRV